mgnify:FL=1
MGQLFSLIVSKINIVYLPLWCFYRNAVQDSKGFEQPVSRLFED